jgi:hypothetical protein
MKPNALFVCAIALLVSSCGRFMGKKINGNGNIKTEERPVSGFKNVEVGGVMNVMVSQGETRPVRIEGDENLLQYIEVLQEGDKIVVRERSGFDLRPTNSINIYVTSPVYHHIEVSGAGNITGQNKITNPDNLFLEASGSGDIKMELDAPEVKAEISGAGSINLKGETRTTDIELSGAGNAHCFDLLSENTTVDISGAGSAEVFASVKLNATVSGVGNVNYKGNATTISQHVSGAGSVSQVR